MKRIILLISLLPILIFNACEFKQILTNKKDVNVENTINDNKANTRPKEINYAYDIENVESDVKDEISNYPIIKFGRYEQDGNEKNGAEPVEWIILDDIEGKYLLMSRDIICYREDILNDKEKMIYDENEDDNGNITLDNKTILNRLSRAIVLEINEEDKDYVISVSFNNNNEIEYNYGNIGDEDFGKYGTWGKLFCLSQKEIEKYFGKLESDGTNRKSIAKGSSISKHYGLQVSDKDTWYYNCGSYFLRDIVRNGNKDYIKFVGQYGHIYDDKIEIPSIDTGVGIRPCIVVDKNCPSLNDKIYKVGGEILKQKLIYLDGKIYGTDNEGKISKNSICIDRYGNYYLTNENGEVDALNMQYGHFFKMDNVNYPYIIDSDRKQYLLNTDGSIKSDYYTSEYAIDRINGLLIRFNDDLSIAQKYHIKDTKAIGDEWHIGHRIVLVDCDYDENIIYHLQRFVNKNKVVTTDNKKMYVKVRDDDSNDSDIDISKSGKGFVKEDNNKKRFYNDDASICYSGIYNINGKKYVFDENGYLVKNDNFFGFLANDNGILIEERGLVKLGNHYYINDNNDYFLFDVERGFNLSDCSLCINSFYKIDNKIYYCKENGQIAQNEWITDRYYFDENGILTIGKFNINDKKLLRENNSYVRYYYLH